MLREEVRKEWQKLKSKFFQLSDFRSMVVKRFSNQVSNPEDIKDLRIISWQVGDGPIIEEVD